MANKQLGFWGHIKEALSSLTGFSGVSLNSYAVWGNTYGFGNFNWAADGVLNNEFVFQSAKVYLNKLKVAPIIVSKIVDEKSYRRYKEYRKNNTTQSIVVKTKEYGIKALQELDSHPLIDLLNNPNNYQTATEFRSCVAAYMKLDKGAFILKESPGKDSIRKVP